MTARNVGGAMDLEAMRLLHRPADPVQLAAEARRLAATGLTARDVSQALRWPLPLVIEALGRRGSQA